MQTEIESLLKRIATLSAENQLLKEELLIKRIGKRKLIQRYRKESDEVLFRDLHPVSRNNSNLRFV